MMRSGSTLQYNIVKELLDENNKEYTKLGFYNKDQILQNFEKLQKYSSNKNMIYLIKTHDFTKLNELQGAYIIYSFRNLLDVAASLKRKFNVEGNDLILTLKENIDNYYKIIKSKRILIHSYDNLLNSLYRCVEETNSFLELDSSTSTLKKIALKNSPKNITKLQNKNRFIKLIKKIILNSLVSSSFNTKNFIIKIFGKKLIDNLKYKLLPHDKDSLLHLNHISKNFGQDGSWKEILSEKEIKVIKSEFKNWTQNNDKFDFPTKTRTT